MSFVKTFLCFILFPLIVGSPQLNVHFTDPVSNEKSDVVFEHDCLHVAALIKKENDPRQMISYCLTEFPSKWNIQENNLGQKYSFDQLAKQNITSEQLYLWSAPIDVIERYQLYLNHLSTSNQLSSTGLQLFYKCIPPRFGPLCQYSLDYYESYHLTLNEVVYDFYQNEYSPVDFTCYTHLECNRGSTSACLDWTEICDGGIDCLNDGIDEENCWQLEINDCGENEYRCDSGQCVHKIFLHDDLNSHECLDRSDELRDIDNSIQSIWGEPIFSNEDIICSVRHSDLYVRLTSSCIPGRHRLLNEIMFLDTPNSLSEICWLAFKCVAGILNRFDSKCLHLCSNRTCQQIINDTCPNLLFMPGGARVFGHMYFGYSKEDLLDNKEFYVPTYICYNEQLCGGFYQNRSLLIDNNSTCRHPNDFPVEFPTGGRGGWVDKFVKGLYEALYQCNTIIYNNSFVCDSLTMYRCINSSKCISIHRLCDTINDCDYKDDEQCPLINGNCYPFESKILFKCSTTNKCISSKRVHNGFCDCEHDEYGLCDDEITILDYPRKHISFPTACDGFTELLPININGRNETDETECQYWKCNNTYTRCDGLWNCLNGADEVNCNLSSLLFKCPLHHHICISPITYQLMCLPIEKANDGNIDCLGATDEPTLCRSNHYHLTPTNFHCKNDTSRPCIWFDGNCGPGTKYKCRDIEPICNYSESSSEWILTDVQKFLIERISDLQKEQIVYFSIDKSKQLENEERTTYSSIVRTTRHYPQHCHRGLPLRVWLNSKINLSNITCLCPSNYYGNICQYQNQRVSLTLRLQAYSDSRKTLFSLIILLIDDTNQRIIHSYKQLTYIYVKDCQTKFNFNLLYSNRPKDLSKHYSIHIDIYEKISFKYYGSFLIPLNYLFLPVHRIALLLNIPRTSDNVKSCSNMECIHGKCIKYLDNPNDISFCQCDEGWSGKSCTISHMCTCSPGSLCIGISPSNRSICICSLNKWGYQCLLSNTICHSKENITCENNGKCISVDQYMISQKKYLCICPKGFSGERCEIVDNKIILSFDKDIILPDTILVHFIRVINNGLPENGSTFTTIPINQNTVTIQWSYIFHIAFVELFNNNYYLMIVQQKYNKSTTISQRIKSSDRCIHINEVLNETIVKSDLLRRIKYYHLVCQKHISCFYDNNHFCLCNDYNNERLANCFEFNPSIKHDCFGQSNCENNAQCLQDKPICPQTSMCICPKCYYGTRCQFSSSLFDLSLDPILGYHIQPHINIKHQPHIVKVSVGLTSIIITVGLINGILSMITFKSKETCKVGCGLYLFGSSITTLLTVIIFTLKFSILIIAQMTYITNRSFLYFQCFSMDFLLRSCLYMDRWLNACAGMERAFAIIKGTHFDKTKSKKVAKYIIFILTLLMLITNIHDPIHRRLLDDGNDYDDEKRIWCIISYSSGLQIYNTFLNMFHFFIPFILNIISAVIIIVMTARQRTHRGNDQSYRRILREQLYEHRHLLIAPIILVILALPSLIISLVSNCIKSSGNSWLFLFGYFVSFIPPMLCFVVFVLPSKLYKKELRKSIIDYGKKIRTQLYVT